MPLNEVTANVHRLSTDDKHGFKSVKQTTDSLPHIKPPPLAVQNMLKRSTETGNEGMFAQRPPRVPRSSTQSSLGLHSRISASSSLLPTNFDHHHVDFDINAAENVVKYSLRGLKRNDTIRSSLSTHRYRPQSERAYSRGGSYPHSQSYSFYKFRHQNHLHNHQSAISVRNKTTAHRLPTPQQRPYRSTSIPSPAVSNYYEYHLRPKSPLSRHGSRRTSPASPSSSLFVKPGYQNSWGKHNGSTMSLRSLPSPVVATWHRRWPHHSSVRSITPASAMYRNNQILSTVSFGSDATSPTGSVVPFYYDYSESFHGRQALLSPDENPMIKEKELGQNDGGKIRDRMAQSDQTSLEQTPKSELDPIELTTKHGRKSSEQSARHSRRTSERSIRSTLILSHEPIPEDLQLEQDIVSQSLRHKTRSRIEPSVSSGDTAELIQDRNSSSGFHNWPSPSSSTFFTNASRSPRNLSDLAARAHSPHTITQPVGSIDEISKKLTSDNNEHHKAAKLASWTSKYQLPSFEFKPLAIGTPPRPRPSTSPVSVIEKVPEIVSPKPERPTSSQSRRRFSRILDIDHNDAIINFYCSGSQPSTTKFTKLESVQEDSNSTEVLSKNVLHETNGIQKATEGPFQYSGPPSSLGRWSGITSHDKSTIESLLERHIDSLGLQPGHSNFSNLSVCYQELDEHHPASDTQVSKSPSTLLSLTGYQHHEKVGLECPTSVTSSAQRHLIPAKLFADSATTPLPKFPFAGSESDAGFSLSWTDEKGRPSYGWLTLPSNNEVRSDGEKSRQTLLSGDYADVDSEHTRDKFVPRRHLSPDLTPPSIQDEHITHLPSSSNDQNLTPRHNFKGKLPARDDSQEHRKIRICVKTNHSDREGARSDIWVSTDEKTTLSEGESRGLELTSAPISAIDGFVELSGESANTSQQSLTSLLHGSHRDPSKGWSSIAAAMPIPPRKAMAMGRKDSTTSATSQGSSNSKYKPVNSSRLNSSRLEYRKQNHELKSQISVPQLEHPDLGPTIRLSQFDLSAGHGPSPKTYKKSSFSEPRELLQHSPTKHSQRNVKVRRRLQSIRQIIPASIRSLTFSSSPGQTHQQFSNCDIYRAQASDARYGQGFVPETMVMSDFAYRKHKLFGRLKKWCRRRCAQRPFTTKKRRSLPPGGFIV